MNYFQKMIDQKFNTNYVPYNQMYDEMFEISMKYSKPIELAQTDEKLVHAAESLLQIAFDTLRKLYADYDIFQPQLVITDDRVISVKVAMKKKC